MSAQTTLAHEARIVSDPMVNNLLINPGFEIWQRGAGPFGPGPSVSIFTADEWYLRVGSTSSMSVSRNSSPKFGNYCAQITATATGAGESHTLSQGIENSKSLEGRWITFSVWVKSALENNVRIAISDWTGTGEEVGSPYNIGGAAWQNLVVSKLIRTGLTTVAAHAHSFSIEAYLYIDKPSTVYVDGAVLAEGYFPEGIPFVPSNPSEDQTNCERFYQRSVGAVADPMFSGNVVSGNTYQAACFFHTMMYAAPTVTLTNSANNLFPAAVGSTVISSKGFREYRVANGTGNGGYFRSNYVAEVP